MKTKPVNKNNPPFVCNLHYEFHADAKPTKGYFDRDFLVEYLSDAGYNTEGLKEAVEKLLLLHNRKGGHYFCFAIDTFRDGSVKMDEIIPKEFFWAKDHPDVIVCRERSQFTFLSPLRADGGVSDAQYLIDNSFGRWYRYEGDKPNFYAAAKRMGFRPLRHEDIAVLMEQNPQPRFDYGWRMNRLINDRASGKTTRLVDKYVQEIFENAGDWVSVHDHYPGLRAQMFLIERICSRFQAEHHINLEVRRHNFNVRINPDDINFLN